MIILLFCLVNYLLKAICFCPVSGGIHAGTLGKAGRHVYECPAHGSALRSTLLLSLAQWWM